MIKIISGPCSIDNLNKSEIFESLKISFSGKPALYGVRVVGLKSRTSFDPVNQFIGIDVDVYLENLEILLNNSFNFKIAPSIEISNEIHSMYGDIYTATEIVDPWLQCLNLSRFSFSNKVIIWNPAVMHLGFPIKVMTKFAQKNKWIVGLKNGKNIGSSIESSEILNEETSMDKSWAGLLSYANDSAFFIHRGVEIKNTEGFRNLPVHKLCERVKRKTEKEFFFDPSHICGPKKRSDILDITIDAMKMRIESGEYLYDGILVETGTSKSDTEQHITISELENLISKLSKFRKLNYE